MKAVSAFLSLLNVGAAIVDALVWLWGYLKPILKHTWGPAVGAAVVAGWFWWTHPHTPDPPDDVPSVDRPVILPAVVQADVGQLVTLRPKALARVRWVVPPNCKEKIDTHEDASGDLVVVPRAEGVSYIAACCVVDRKVSEATWVKIQAGKAPEPGPDPRPPGPTPPPVPPAPPSLTKKLQDCYAADPAAAELKAGQKSLLVSLYAAMAIHARDPAIKTTTDLRADLERVARETINQSLLTECRKIIAAEIGQALGTDAKDLDDPTRAKAVAVFESVAAALRAVK